MMVAAAVMWMMMMVVVVVVIKWQLNAHLTFHKSVVRKLHNIFVGGVATKLFR